MKIAIVGSGGVGAYFGAKLAKAGNDVVFLARGAHLEAIKKNGLTIKSVDGDFKLDGVKATDKIPEIGKVDLVILGVKAWQIKQISWELQPIINENTLVLPLQNGVLASAELTEFISPKNILGGLCRIISKIESPGVINHLGIKPVVVFGELDQSISKRIKWLKCEFENANISARISENITVDLWKKFMFICSGGLLAVTRSTYGEVRETEETKLMLNQLFSEIYHLALKSGIELEPEIVQKSLDFIDSLPYNSTASMARDVWEGKPSEIEYQNGTVVKLADELGVHVPVNRFIYACLLPLEKRARKN